MSTLLQKFWKNILVNIKTSGSFAIGGVLSGSIVLPGLIVADVGLISLPLSVTQAQQLIQSPACALSPFGRGEDTLTDVTVRKSWQFSPSQFQITHPDWNQTLLPFLIKEKIKPGLGVTTQNIEPHLYKLLLYETGGHFQPHRDTEKEDGMMGTLIIELPSTYTGGELQVEHDGQCQRYSWDTQSASQFHFAAFYADCLHSIQPLTGGYRLSLVYNLVMVPSNLPPITTPNPEPVITQLKQALDKWYPPILPKAETGAMFCWRLRHRYTQAGLNWSSLKNEDKAVGDVMQEMNRRFDLQVHLAFVTVTETGGVDGNESEDYDEETASVEERTVQLAIPSLSKYHNFTLLPLDVLNRDLKKITKWDDVEIERTGNEGANFSRTYQRTVLIFYPAAHSFLIQARENLEEAITTLWDRVHLEGNTPTTVNMAQTVLHYYQKQVDRYYQLTGRGKLLGSLVHLGDWHLIQKWLKYSYYHLSIEEQGWILQACQRWGYAEMESSLQKLITTNSHLKTEIKLELLQKFILDPIDPIEDQRTWLLLWAIPQMNVVNMILEFAYGKRTKIQVCMTLLETVLKADVLPFSQLKSTSLIPLIWQCLHSLSYPEDHPLWSAVIACILTCNVNEVTVPALLTIDTEQKEGRNQPFRTLVESCIQHITHQLYPGQVAAQALAWSQSMAAFTCTCNECTNVRQFLTATTTQTGMTFKWTKDQRMHVEQQLNRLPLSMFSSTVNPRTHPQSFTIFKKDLCLHKEHKRQQDIILLGKLLSISINRWAAKDC